MASYTSQELLERNKIIKSQQQLWDFLNADIINTLINLFDDSDTVNIKIKNINLNNKFKIQYKKELLNNFKHKKISEYIEAERKSRGLDESKITLKGEFYFDADHNPTLFLGVKKNGIEFIHFTIHLVPLFITPETSGMIHFSKNLYKEKVSKPKKKIFYALVSVQQPDNKPNSLFFSIDYAYSTGALNHSFLSKSGEKMSNIVLENDLEMQNEMDSVVNVLNRIFDEDNKEFYIGNKKENITLIHKNINFALKKINNPVSKFKRTNTKKTFLKFANSSNDYNYTNKINKSKIIKLNTRKVNKYGKKIRLPTKGSKKLEAAQEALPLERPSFFNRLRRSKKLKK
jgi:hypothetical protein